MYIVYMSPIWKTSKKRTQVKLFTIIHNKKLKRPLQLINILMNQKK